MMTAPTRSGPFVAPRLFCLAAALTLAWLAIYPYRLTDGDSSVFAAMARAMAQEGGNAWLAPIWSFQDGTAFYHEHPPGAFWPAAVLMRLGLSDNQAPLMANALALLFLVATTWWLTGDGLGFGALAAGILLLHFPVLHYTVRFGLEVPFAACVTAAVAAARIERRGATLGVGLFAAGAALTRGVFSLALPPLLLFDAIQARDRRRLARVAAGLLLALALVLLFDFGHMQATGHSFWNAYLHKQVLPSLKEGGTPYPNQGSTALYYGSRLLIYSAPWLPLALVLWLRSRSRVPVARRETPGAVRADARLALLWILLFLGGAATTWRYGSRYLFAAWPASAWLTALALRGWWQARSERTRSRIAVTVLALVPVLTVGKCLLTPRDAWWRAADALREARPRLTAPRADGGPPSIYGPFPPHDDRMKQFLRYHAGLWAFPEPRAGAPAGSLIWFSPDDPPVATIPTVLQTDLFRLGRVP